MRRSPDTSPPGLFSRILVGRKDITWAGGSPGGHGFCFGTESGEVFVTDYSGRRYSQSFVPPSYATGAVNGVAFAGRRMLVSTPEGCAIWRIPKTRLSDAESAEIAEGGHGVVAGAGGAFFVPLGVGGVLSVHEDSPRTYSTFTNFATEGSLNAYHVASLANAGGRQVLAVDRHAV